MGSNRKTIALLGKRAKQIEFPVFVIHICYQNIFRVFFNAIIFMFQIKLYTQ